jgi:hypothetical protein
MTPPTYETGTRFDRDLHNLTKTQRDQFREAVKLFVDDLRAGPGFRPSLRVKRVQGTRDVWEMTWAADGRATWQYGREIQTGEPHVIWRRVGTHQIFTRP